MNQLPLFFESSKFSLIEHFDDIFVLNEVVFDDITDLHTKIEHHANNQHQRCK